MDLKYTLPRMIIFALCVLAILFQIVGLSTTGWFVVRSVPVPGSAQSPAGPQPGSSDTGGSVSRPVTAKPLGPQTDASGTAPPLLPATSPGNDKIPRTAPPLLPAPSPGNDKIQRTAPPLLTAPSPGKDKIPRTAPPLLTAPSPGKDKIPRTAPPLLTAPSPGKDKIPRTAPPLLTAPSPGKDESPPIGPPLLPAPSPGKNEYPQIGPPRLPAPSPGKNENPQIGTPLLPAPSPGKDENPPTGPPLLPAPSPGKDENSQIGPPLLPEPTPGKEETARTAPPLRTPPSIGREETWRTAPPLLTPPSKERGAPPKTAPPLRTRRPSTSGSGGAPQTAPPLRTRRPSTSGSSEAPKTAPPLRTRPATKFPTRIPPRTRRTTKDLAMTSMRSERPGQITSSTTRKSSFDQSWLRGNPKSSQEQQGAIVQEIVTIYFGLWSMEVCFADTQCSDKDSVADTISTGLLQGHVYVILNDLRVEVICGLLSCLVGTVGCGLYVKPLVLKERPKITFLVGFLGMSLSGILVFISVSRAVSFQDTLVTLLTNNVVTSRTLTPWSVVMCGLGALMSLLNVVMMGVTLYMDRKVRFVDFKNDVHFTNKEHVATADSTFDKVTQST